MLLTGDGINGEEQDVIKTWDIFLCGDDGFEIEYLPGKHYIFRHGAEDVCIFGRQDIFQRDGGDGSMFGKIAGNDSTVCSEEEHGIFCMFTERHPGSGGDGVDFCGIISEHESACTEMFISGDMWGDDEEDKDTEFFTSGKTCVAGNKFSHGSGIHFLNTVIDGICFCGPDEGIEFFAVESSSRYVKEIFCITIGFRDDSLFIKDDGGNAAGEAEVIVIQFDKIGFFVECFFDFAQSKEQEYNEPELQCNR